MFPYLFSPITINKCEIKNRIVYPSLGLLYSYDGKLNDRYVNYFRERARGGAGVVTVGPVGVDLVGIGSVAMSLANDREIPSFKSLAAGIKSEGARAWVQLYHAGAYAYSFLINNEKQIAPSAVYSKMSKSTPRAMTIEDIKKLQEDFTLAALRAKEAGFDGVEIIASAGYLITQFLSPLKNLRTDEYGGSFDNRVRFGRELVELMRSRLGSDYPLTIRIAGNDFVPGSNTSAETVEFAKVYERAGVDAISVTGGWHESHVPQLPMEAPRGVFSYLALNIKRAVKIPVYASNRITDPELAEKTIRDGLADLINLGRVLIADPEWPVKAREGRVDEIRPCVACNQGCTDELFSGRPVFCVGNPRAGFEAERVIKKASSPKRVMVIGAGPGGLEAAVTAAQAGHDVSLYEKSDDIGGQLWIAGAPPHKHELLQFIRYYRTMLKKLDVPIFLNTEVTAATVSERKPDQVIVAEGAEPILPKIEGITEPTSVSAWEVLRRDPMLGQDIAVIGGGAVGIETALFLAAKGTLSPEVLHFLMAFDAESSDRLQQYMFHGSKSVTIFEMLPTIGKDVGRSTRWILVDRIKRFGVRVVTGAKVLSISGGKVRYEKEGREDAQQFGSIVLAFGSRSVKRTTAEIEKTGVPFKAIGDCVRPAKINDAIHEGFLAALSI
ncbi:MAG: FAD-dependent oxidoreductase [Spirochaetes bacterium]|nr:MAG: FAD-dependent oxidoreductase [Spirochaetota bacterium]